MCVHVCLCGVCVEYVLGVCLWVCVSGGVFALLSFLKAFPLVPAGA